MPAVFSTFAQRKPERLKERLFKPRSNRGASRGVIRAGKRGNVARHLARALHFPVMDDEKGLARPKG